MKTTILTTLLAAVIGTSTMAAERPFDYYTIVDTEDVYQKAIDPTGQYDKWFMAFSPAPKYTHTNATIRIKGDKYVGTFVKGKSTEKHPEMFSFTSDLVVAHKYNYTSTPSYTKEYKCHTEYTMSDPKITFTLNYKDNKLSGDTTIEPTFNNEVSVCGWETSTSYSTTEKYDHSEITFNIDDDTYTATFVKE